MRRILIATLTLWAIAPMAVMAWQDDAQEEMQTVAEQIAALNQEYRQEQIDFSNRYRAAKNNEERQAILAERPQPDKYAAKFLAIAKQYADDPAAVEALVWVVTYGNNSMEFGEALTILSERHADSDKLGNVMTALSRKPSPATEEFLTKIIETNESREMKAKATFTLAMNLKLIKDYGERMENSGQAEAMKQYLGEELANYVATRFDSDMATAEILELFETVATEYADVPEPRGTMGALAERELFELRNLVVGAEAPDIVGEDIEGEEFKLSDYRGKVVMLDFWGDW